MRLNFLNSRVPVEAAPPPDSATKAGGGGTPIDTAKRVSGKIEKPVSRNKSSGRSGLVGLRSNPGAAVARRRLTSLVEKHDKQIKKAFDLRSDDRRGAARASEDAQKTWETIKTQYAHWCTKVDWADPEARKDALTFRLPYQYGRGAELFEHLLPKDPGTFVTAAIHAFKLTPIHRSALSQIDWGRFFKAGDAGVRADRFTALLPHAQTLAKMKTHLGRNQLDETKRKFLDVFTELMDDPARHPQLLEIAAVFHNHVDWPDLLPMVQAAKTDEAKTLINHLLSDYLPTDPPTAELLKRTRARIEAFEGNLRHRLPMDAMFAALRTAETQLVDAAPAETTEQRQALLTQLTDKDALVRAAAFTGLSAWVDTPGREADKLDFVHTAFQQFPDGLSGTDIPRAEQAGLRSDLVEILERAAVAALEQPDAAARLLAVLPNTSAISPKTVSGILKAGGPSEWLVPTAPAMLQLPKLELPTRRRTKKAKPVEPHAPWQTIYRSDGHREAACETALEACTSTTDPKALVDWVALTENLQANRSQTTPQQITAATKHLLEHLDLARAPDRAAMASWVKQFRTEFPSDQWPQFARAAMKAKTYGTIVDVLRYAPNGETLATTLAADSAIKQGSLIALTDSIIDGKSGIGRSVGKLMMDVFQRVVDATAPGKPLPDGLKKLRTNLARNKQHRVPIRLVDALLGIPSTLRTADVDADLKKALGEIRNEKTRLPAIARVREILLETDDAQTLGLRLRTVLRSVDRALGFLGWLGRSNRKKAEADAHQILNEVLDPAFGRWAEKTDLSDPAAMSEVVQLSLHLQKKGHVFAIPADALEGVDADALSEDDAIALLHQATEPAQALASKSVRKHHAVCTDLTSQAKLTGRVAGTTAEPTLRPPADVEPGEAWLDLLGQGRDFYHAPGAVLRREMLDGLSDSVTRRWDEAQTTEGRAPLLPHLKHLPAGLDRNAIANRLTDQPWIDVTLVAQAAGLIVADPPLAPNEWMLSKSLENFPGDALEWVAYLEGNTTADAVFAQIEVPKTRASVDALEDFRSIWTKASGDVRQNLLARGLKQMFQSRQALPDGTSAAERAKSLMKAHVLDGLRRDPDLAAWADDFAAVLDRLSVERRANLIADLVLEPAEGTDLISVIVRHGGILAVKGAQQLSEDPDVPTRVRNPLKAFLDSNAELTPIEIYRRIPRDMLKTITAFGPRLGTGSAKQTLLVSTTHRDDPLVAAVTLPEAEKDLAEVESAVAVVPEMDYLLKRLAPLVHRELDLVAEGEAFGLVGESQMGQLAEVGTLKVIASSKNCLIREGFDGKTLKQLAEAGPLPNAVKDRLRAVHRAMIMDAFDTRELPEDGETFVFTDPHIANLADDGELMYAFDPGQYGRLGKTEASLFVRMLVAFSEQNLSATMRDDAIDGLMKVCGASERAPLEAAYDRATGEAEGSAGYRLQLFFNACSKADIDIPAGFFAAAKMMHILASQSDDLELGNHVAGTVGDLFVQQLGPLGKVMAWLKT